MKVETKKLDAHKMQLDIEVPSEVVKKKFDEVIERVAKEAKIPGFRPGKAPRDVLEKHHGKLIREEVIKDLVPEAYQHSLESQKVGAIELPEINDVKLEANVLSFKAVVEVRPEIEVKDYKNIKLKYKKAVVNHDDIDKAIENFKKARKAEVVDDSFAKRLGYKTLESMRGSLERQLLVQKENDLRYHLQDDLLKQILAKVNFRIPPSLIGRRLEELVREAKTQLAMRGATKEQIISQDERLRKELSPDAEVQVKTFLVLDEIAKREHIAESEHLSQDVIEFLLSQAQWIEE